LRREIPVPRSAVATVVFDPEAEIVTASSQHLLESSAPVSSSSPETPSEPEAESVGI
jgi:hypothetical protein